LPISKYKGFELQETAQQAFLNGDSAAIEVTLSQAFLQFAQDMTAGVVKPRSADDLIFFRPKPKPTAALLTGVAEAISVTDYLASLRPQGVGYDRLMDEKTRLEEIIAQGGWGATVPARKTLRPGRSSGSVVALRARLEAMGFGYLGDSPVYDEAMVATIKLVQTRFGLNPDGVAGPGTLGAINVSAQERLGQVLVNLERARWISLPQEGRYIYVNLSDQTMRVVDDGTPTFTSRVVIGRNSTDLRTPEFAHKMSHIIINPFWHVPTSIAEKEYLPLLQEDPLALEKRGMWLLNKRGQRMITDGGDFSVYAEGNFPFVVKQPPGGRNALGRVKFMFPNRHNIYLHDTPAKSLFVKDRRVFSHGCVRVQRPFDLAYHLLAKQVENPIGTFHWYLKRGREQQIDLKEPVPIFLSYNSAWVNEQGTAQYRADIYARDKKVLRALERAGVSLHGAEG